MVHLSKRWMVRDVTIDGISLVTNYRAQFDRVIRGSSYRELLARLRVKVGSELPRPASAGPETPAADLVKSPAFELRWARWSQVTRARGGTSDDGRSAARSGAALGGARSPQGRRGGTGLHDGAVPVHDARDGLLAQVGA